MKDALLPDLHIQRITQIAPAVDGTSIVVRAEALRQNERTELEIAVTTDLAPTMALALLATTAQARAHRDELDPALEALGAAVVCSASEGKVRLQLLFDRGAVLPLELTLEAAQALSAGLVEYLGASQRRLAKRHD